MVRPRCQELQPMRSVGRLQTVRRQWKASESAVLGCPAIVARIHLGLLVPPGQRGICSTNRAPEPERHGKTAAGTTLAGGGRSAAAPQYYLWGGRLRCTSAGAGGVAKCTVWVDVFGGAVVTSKPSSACSGSPVHVISRT